MSDVLRFGKKIFTVSVVAMTIAWSVGLAALVPAGVSAAVAVGDVEAGDLIKLADQSSVYLVNENMERMYFAFGWLYKTWFADYSLIKTLPAGSDLDEHFPPATRGAVSVRPGSCELLKSPASPAVYATAFDGIRHRIGSEAAAAALCGPAWASHVHDVPDFVIGLFPMGGELDGLSPFPGQIIRVASGPIYVVGADSKAYAVEGTLPAFLAADVRTVATLPAMGTGSWTVASLTADVAQLSGEPNTPNPTTSSTSATGDLTVSLAGNTAEADVVPGGAQNVEYLSVVLKATSADADVDSITFHRGGVGSDDDFNKIYIYSNGVRLDNGRTLNSDDEVTFNVNLHIAKGASQTLVLKADMDTLGDPGATNGDQNRFEIRSKDDVEAGGDVGGSFPVRGNLLAVGAQDIGTVEISNTPSDSTAKIGQNNVKVGEFEVDASASDDDISATSITLQQKGSIELDALSNIVLKQNGKTIAEGEVVGDDKVQFEFDEAQDIDAGDTLTYRIYADIGVTDVLDTIMFILDESSDFSAWSNDNAGFEVGVTNSLTSTDADEVTVNGGKISVDFDGENDSVRQDQNDASFGTFTILATAEDLDVNSMLFTLERNGAASSTALEDIKLRDKGGRGVYSLEDNDDDQLIVEDLTLEQGVKYEFEVLADVSATAADATTYEFSWAAADVDAEGLDSDNTVAADDFSSSVLTGPTMDVDNSSLVVRSSALSDETVVNGAKNVLLYRGTLEAGNTSDVILSSMSFVKGAGSDVWEDLVDGMKLYVAAGNATIDPTKDEALANDNDVTADDEALFDGFDYTVKAGSANRVKFEVYADITDGETDGDVQLGLDVIDATDVDDEDVAAEVSSGALLSAANLDSSRVVTVEGTGTLSMDVDNDYTAFKNDRLALAGTAKFVAGRIELKADNEDVLVQDLGIVFSPDASFASVVDSVSLYSDVGLSDASLVASSEWSTTTIFQDADYLAKDGVTSYLYVVLALNSVGTDEDGISVPGRDFTFAVSDDDDDQVIKGDESGDAITIDDGSLTIDATDSNNIEITPVKLYVTSTLANGSLSGGQQTIFSFKVSADAGRNTDTTNEVLRAILTSSTIELTTDVGTADAENVSDIQFCREGGDCIDLETEGTLSDEDTQVGLETVGLAYANLNSLDGTDNEVVPGEEAVFYIKATFLNTTDHSAQVKIVDLDAGGLTYSVDYTGSDAVDYTVTDLRKDAPRGTDYPDLVGGNLD